ncbi:MAG: protein phosphatase 2C domain-containing protein [Armatimonadota bacterium]
MPRAIVNLAWKTQAGHRHHVEGLGNEDAAFVTDEHPVFDAVLMVADGMGGHPRPQEASQAAVAAARERLFDPARLERAPDPARLLLEALQAAHRAVRALRTSGTGKPPGTTLSLALAAEGVLYVAHVGDGSVFLAREGRVSALAGGEDRRAGNRPAQFLGQDDPLEPECRRLALAVGDRLLLCTDGLTRYFGAAGGEELTRVLGRAGADPQVIASQLTAHSRSRDYDDDTTVAVAEVTALTEAPRPVSARAAVPPKSPEFPREDAVMASAPSARPAKARGVSPLLAALLGAGLLAGGFYAGRTLVPAPPGAPGAPDRAAAREPADPGSLRHLPPGNVILWDELGNRIYALGTRNVAPPSGPLDLQGFTVGRDGRLAAAGRFRYDPTRGLLSDAGGRSYPVELDASSASLRVLRGGTLQVETQPKGARVFVDGQLAGSSPLRVTLAAGRHQVRVVGATWQTESEVEVVAGRSTTLSVGAP